MFSDDTLALRFAAEHSDYLRCIPGLGWYRWDGNCWKADQGTVRETIRKLCRDAAEEAKDSTTALKLGSAHKIAAVESLARFDSRIVAPIDRWDCSPWLLNTQSGVIDLQSGELSPPDPSLLTSRIATASPGGEAPRWITFLAELTAGDADLAGYLQRLAGYCLTGSTREQSLFFLLGAGANGKSVFVAVLRSVLGDYATTAVSDLLTDSILSRHPTEIASLRGARFVIVPEVERRARFAESRMKALTGGDQVAARFMRQDLFTFTPQFKIMITGNRVPELASVDEASRRRLQIIPFGQVVPAEKRDPLLVDKLLSERDGILAWAINGCLDWQLLGLQPPPSVRDLSGFYLDAQDLVGRFIDARCEGDASFAEGSSELFLNWSAWCREQAEPPGSQRAFVQELHMRGCHGSRSGQRRTIRGLRLRVDQERDAG